MSEVYNPMYPTASHLRGKGSLPSFFMALTPMPATARVHTTPQSSTNDRDIERYGTDDTNQERTKPNNQKQIGWFVSYLLGEVVDADVVLGGDEEEGLAGVELHRRHAPLVLAERVLRRLLRQLVHQHRRRAACRSGARRQCLRHTSVPPKK
eukprot:5471878-Pyramimonas_sp.AAC.1